MCFFIWLYISENEVSNIHDRLTYYAVHNKVLHCWVEVQGTVDEALNCQAIVLLGF